MECSKLACSKKLSKNVQELNQEAKAIDKIKIQSFYTFRASVINLIQMY